MGRIDLEMERVRASYGRTERHERLKKLKSAIAIVDDVQSTAPSDSDDSITNSTTSPAVIPGENAMDVGLYKAATQGDVDKFIDALERYSVGNKMNPTEIIMNQLTPIGNTFLHVAATFGHVELTGFLLYNFRSLILLTNHKGDTALHLATRFGHFRIIEILVTLRCYNPRNNSQNFGDVTSKNTAGSIRTLNNQGNNPLHDAIIKGWDPAVDYFIKKDPEAVCYASKGGNSPFYLLLEAGKIKAAKATLNSIRRMFRYIDDDELIVAQRNSMIHAAIVFRNQGLLKDMLIVQVALIYSKDENGQNPLHFASQVGFLDGVRLLLNDFNMNAFERNNDGLCAIHVASEKDHVHIVEELLKHCLDHKEYLTTNGQNILHVAARNGKEKMVRYILSNPNLESLVNDKDNDGNTPLHLAALNWHPKIISLLTWDKRLNVKVLNNEGLTALKAAELNLETLPSYRKRLTWMMLTSSGVPRGKNQSKTELQRSKSTQSKPYNMDYYKDRVNTLLLVSTLVATVTFAAGFTVPGGNTDRGMATMVSKIMFQIFVICDTIALYSSILVAVTLIWAQLGDLILVLNALTLAIPLLGVSLSMMALAFMVSIHLIVSEVIWLANLVLVMGILSCSCLLLVFIPLILPYTSNFRVFRHICYYPMLVLMLAAGSYDDDLQQLEE